MYCIILCIIGYSPTQDMLYYPIIVMYVLESCIYYSQAISSVHALSLPLVSMRLDEHPSIA